MSRTYTQQTIKQLFATSGNNRAFPDCNQNIVNENGTVIGEICHIQALNEKGARYSNELNDKNNFDNLILLCPTHHKIIDKEPDKYPVVKLNEWKKQQISNAKTKQFEFNEKQIYSQIENIKIVQHITNNYGIDYNVYNKVIIELSKVKGNNETLKNELSNWVEKYKMLKNNLTKSITNNYLNRAKKYFEKGNFSESENQYLLSIENDKKNIAKKYYTLGVLSELQLNEDKAFSYYKFALENEPNNITYLKECGYLAYTTDNFEVAFDYLQKTIAKFKKKTEKDTFLENIKLFLENKLVTAVNNNNIIEIAILEADLGTIFIFLHNIKKGKELLIKSQNNLPTYRKNYVSMFLNILNMFGEEQISTMIDLLINQIDEKFQI